jgi:hypothetical protein
MYIVFNRPWNEKEGEWYSSLNLFAPSKGGSPDIIRFLQQDIDLRPSKIQSWWKRRQEGLHIFDQRCGIVGIAYNFKSSHTSSPVKLFW